jgi:tetratricopeptide (TPR) repeat protein
VPMVAALLRARLSMQQQHDLEEQLVPALTRWLEEGKMGTSEASGIVAELAALYLKLHHLLKAAELLIRYGWLSFNQGYGPRLARLAQNRMQEFDWHRTEDNECGGLLLHNYLTPFLSKIIASRERMSDYQRIREVAIAEKVQFQAETEVHITHYLMLFALNELRFEEALSFFEVCANRLKSHLVDDRDLQASLLEESTMLFGRWSEHAEEQREEQKARAFREQTITLYRQSVTLLSTNEELSLLKSNLTKKRLGRSLNSLAYQLYRIGQYDEALKCIDLSIVLKEQGYVQFGGLVAAYGDKSQILAELGHFQEALHFDEKALKNVQLLANMGHALSQEEIWIYLVNRGCLYLRMGRIDEAERLLQDALPHIHPRRRVYHMLAKKALEEVEQWRQHATLPEHQLDWRWIQRYRDLDAFDAYWWWAQAGPFNEQEQQEWDQLYHPGLDEERKELLGGLIAQSRQRELVAALSEQREPHFHYPALDIQEVRRRISGMIQLDTEIQQTEPNVIVRRLYHDAIEEETNFLRMIEATYEGDSERFRALNQLVEPEPTFEEMQGALSSLRRVLVQGLTRPDTAKISQHLIQWLSGPLHLSFDFSSNEQEMQELRQNETQTHFQPQQTITPQAAKRFFNAILHESGYDEWQVVIDPKASGPRVDSALRHLYVPDSRLSTERIRHYLAHELAGHVARSVAGERSLLGLLGIGTKGYQPTEEGVAYHQERLAMALYGKVFDDSGTWFGTLATGFASGVATPPQTFLSLFPFFEALHLLFRLLEQQDKDVQTAQQRARSAAFSRCLRTYRGVPNLEKAGVCFSKDAVYFRGFRQVEDALAQDETILDRLSVGKVALEYLPEIQELGLAIPPHPLRDLAYDPQLEAYMLSFELHEEQPDQPA